MWSRKGRRQNESSRQIHVLGSRIRYFITHTSALILRATARGFIYPVVEWVSTALLATRGRIMGRRDVQPLTARGGERVMVIAAHPDDETIGCAGALEMHRRAGDRVVVLIVTDGSGSRAGGLGPREMAQKRRGEVAEVARQLEGCEFEELCWIEGRWEEATLETELLKRVQLEQPNVIYAPSCIDFHPEHLKVAKALAAALIRLGGGGVPRVRVYEMQVPLGTELANRYLGLGEARQTKELAIAAYTSQRGALDLWKRQARYLGRTYGAEEGAEAFWELDAAGYCRVMTFAHWDWRSTPFKSLSGRPFGDVAAHLKGRRVRLALREIGEGRDAK
jgi:LmbE family N-acetylglucosaminyl deacetylase